MTERDGVGLCVSFFPPNNSVDSVGLSTAVGLRLQEFQQQVPKAKRSDKYLNMLQQNACSRGYSLNPRIIERFDVSLNVVFVYGAKISMDPPYF